MKTKKIGSAAAGIFLAALLIMSHGAADPASPAAAPKLDETAMARVNQMAEILSDAKRFSVDLDIGFDAVQPSGQKIEFGETRKVLLKRPDRFRVDATKRSGEESELVYDGKNLALLYQKENVYASEPRSENIDEVLKYFTEDLGLRLPLAELLDSKLKEVLKSKTREAGYVEESSINGVPCDHVALRGDEVDLQIWISKADEPLPQRVVITYKKAAGRPQFWAQFHNWDLKSKIPDSKFEFNPPGNAKKIAFSPKQETMQPQNAEPVKGEAKS